MRQVDKVRLDFVAIQNSQITPECLPQLNHLVHLCRGTRSPGSTRQVIEILDQHLPNSTLNEMDAGHMGPVTHPDLVLPSLARMLLNEPSVDLG